MTNTNPERAAEDGMKRIGRDPTPAEGSYRRLMENPEFLDGVAFNYFCSKLDVSSAEARPAWDALSKGERDEWCARTMIVASEHAAEHGPTFDPEPPEPGTPVDAGDVAA